MDTVSYLVISNVFTGLALIMTCGVSICRVRFTRCPFCSARLPQEELRTHIGICNEHNVLFMGRLSPTVMAPTTHEQLAVAVPLPPQYVMSPPYPSAPKVAEI